MHWYHIFYVFTLSLSVAICAFLAIYCFKHRGIVGATTFGWISLLGSWGAFVEGLSIVSQSPEAAHAWYNARFITLACLPVAWALFAIEYNGRMSWLSRTRIVLLFAVPAVTQAMIWTNNFHRLWVKEEAVPIVTGPFLLMDTGARVPGPWFWVHTIYGYACLMLGVVLVLEMSLRTVRVYRRQAAALGIGTIILVVGSAIPTFRLIPGMKINPITQVLALSSLIFAWAIFRYRFLDLVPVARDSLVESIDDAVIVMDSQNRVLDLNRAMRSLLAAGFEAGGQTLPAAVIGLPAGEVLAPWRSVARRFQNDADVKTEINMQVGGSEHYFDLHISPLADRRGNLSGRIVVLRDITKRKHAEDEVRLARDVWENTFNAVPDLIAVIDTNFRIVRSNRALADTLGLPQDAVNGATCYDIMHCTTAPIDGCPHRLLMEDGKAHTYELFERNLRGHYLVSASPLYNDTGKLTGSVHVSRNITERKMAEVALHEKTLALNERINELNCLYGISEIVRKPGISLNDIMSETAAIIPRAWKYPEIACVRLTLDTRIYLTDPFVETPWMQAADIVVNGEKRGTVEVCYREEREERDEGPFLREERVLIDAIAERLGRVIERRWAENDLRLSEARLDALHTMNNRNFTTEKELIEYALEEEVRLTGSEIGYFHFVKEDGVNLELFAWSRRVMEACTAATDRHYPLDRAGVWADCARLGRPVVHNDYLALSDRKGYPEGHSPIIRHASVPIFDDDRVMAISGVANKPGRYNEPDIRQMQLFMSGVWKIIQRKRAEVALERALKEKDAILEKLEISESSLRDRNAHMEFDLLIAQSAQKAIVRIRKPESDRLALEYRYRPMEKVGGDYFSFFKSDDGSIGFFIGDVSGHGIAAALFIALLKSITDRAFREYGSTPDEYLRMVNGELVDYISSNFITAIYGIFAPADDGGSMRLRFCNGGHIKPIVMRADGECSFHGAGNMLIGVMEQVYFDVNEMTLGPGDRLLVITDGIAETADANRAMIGFDDGLIDLFRRSRGATLVKTLDMVIREVDRFRGDVPQQDDITLIGFEVL